MGGQITSEVEQKTCRSEKNGKKGEKIGKIWENSTIGKTIPKKDYLFHRPRKTPELDPVKFGVNFLEFFSRKI